jgi:hypothetical protein
MYQLLKTFIDLPETPYKTTEHMKIVTFTTGKTLPSETGCHLLAKRMGVVADYPDFD